MTTSYNCTAAEQRAAGLEHAQRAIRENKCVVFPTDTVYGIAADAFSPLAVTLLLASKGRSRKMPPPVLIPRLNALDGLATDVPAEARRLAEAFWPGGLTLILHAQPSLDWDLGETKGTVALRIPADDIAQDLLTLTGPLAVSSANRTGQAAAQTAADAEAQLAESVEVYLEGGLRPVDGADALPSTIVDATALPLRVVRQGAISLERLRVRWFLACWASARSLPPSRPPKSPISPKIPPPTIPRGTDMQPKVAVAAVTFDRHEELALLLKGLAEQTAPIHSIALVDSGTVPATEVVNAGGDNINYLRSEANLGGAGGIRLRDPGRHGQRRGVDPDDGRRRPPRGCKLPRRTAQDRGGTPARHREPARRRDRRPNRLSFNFRINGLLTNDRSRLAPMGYLPDMVHFFNGALIRTEVFYKIGIPDVKFFIRGDEVDFLSRVKKAGLKHGTLATVAVQHPATWTEMKPVFGGFITPVIPEGEFKRYCYFRNRGYLTRKYRNLRWFGADIVGFPYYFLKAGDLKGLAHWFGAYSTGFRGKGFGSPARLMSTNR